MKLKFTHFEATDLYNAGSSMDAQDPSLKLSISGEEIGHTKRIVDAGVNCEWPEEFEYDLPASKFDFGAKLKVEVFNQNALGLKKPIGHGTVGVSEVIKFDKKQKVQVHIDLTYIDLMSSLDKGKVSFWIVAEGHEKPDKPHSPSKTHKKAHSHEYDDGHEADHKDVKLRPTLLPLWEAKVAAKEAIKVWQADFIKQNGHKPGNADKAAQRELFAAYKSASAIFDAAEPDYKHHPLVDPWSVPVESSQERDKGGGATLGATLGAADPPSQG